MSGLGEAGDLAELQSRYAALLGEASSPDDQASLRQEFLGRRRELGAEPPGPSLGQESVKRIEGAGPTAPPKVLWVAFAISTYVGVKLFARALGWWT